MTRAIVIDGIISRSSEITGNTGNSFLRCWIYSKPRKLGILELLTTPIITLGFHYHKYDHYIHPLAAHGQRRESPKTEVDLMSNEKLIEPALTEWDSSVVSVRKKDGTIRFFRRSEVKYRQRERFLCATKNRLVYRPIEGCLSVFDT